MPIAPRSGHRAWWALLEKGLDADAEYVHIKLGAAKPAWYKAEVAPTGTVPSVIHRGRVILESLTVVEYLDEVAPDRGVRLMPEGAADRAAVRAFAKRLGDSHTAPFYRALSMSPDDVRRGDPRVGALADCLASVEGMFAEQALVNESVGPYFLGARFSVADIAVAPFLDRFSATIPYFTGLPSLLTPAHPRLAACLSACRDRPAFKATAQTPAFYIASYKTYARGKVDAARKVAVKRSAAVAFH